MTHTYTRQKNRLIIFILSTLFIFLASVAVYMYESQKNKMLHDMEKRVEIEINLLAEFLRDNLQRHDYAEAKNFLQKWQTRLPSIEYLDIKLNGLDFYNFGSLEHAVHNRHIIEKQRELLAGETRVTLHLAHDTHNLTAMLQDLAFKLGTFSVILTVGFGTLLWMILSRWILLPLKAEIDHHTNRLRIINRSHEALSKSNFALTHAKNEEELLHRICENIHKVCGYPLVWIGYAEKNRQIDIVTSSGESTLYLDGITINYGDGPEGNGPTGICIKEHRDVIINDTQKDALFTPWKKRAREFGYYSCAAFPIAIQDHVIGALTLYAKETNAFIDEEIALLHELAANLAFGIVALRDQQKIKHLSTTDSLTNLYNRHKINETLHHQLKEAEKSDTPFGVVIIDIDFFKQVNDTHGHQVGDTTLQTFAEILRRNNRSDSDIIGRWGGEEFILILPGTSLHDSVQLARRLREVIQKHNFPVIGTKTASFGVAAYRRGDSVQSLIRRADDALYKAKNGGRNRVESEET